MCVVKTTHAPPWCPPSPVGLYKIIIIATSGSGISATPTNDVTYFPVFTPSSDVPVFPPIEYPLTLAYVLVLLQIFDQMIL